MLANELRIGNRIYIDGVEVTVSAADILTIYQNERFLIEKNLVSPILLTEERLCRLGFKVAFSLSSSRVYSLNDFYLMALSSHEFRIYESEKCLGKPISYLHQLQNLYFLWVGSELSF